MTVKTEALSTVAENSPKCHDPKGKTSKEQARFPGNFVCNTSDIFGKYEEVHICLYSFFFYGMKFMPYFLQKRL